MSDAFGTTQRANSTVLKRLAKLWISMWVTSLR
jgi:hypothetical protein